MSTTIPVAEIFGPTLEGEGPWAGQPTYFLRVGGCDSKCVWCDTAHAVMPDQVRLLERKTLNEIENELHDYANAHLGPDLLAISGGNPALYDLTQIVEGWQKSTRRSGNKPKVLVETQATLFKPWLAEVNLLTMSPKPPSSGLDAIQSFINFKKFWEEYILVKANNSIQNNRTPMGHQAILKVVVFDEEDYAFARDLHVRYPNIPFHLSTGTAMGGLSGKWVPPNDLPIVRSLMHGSVEEMDTLIDTRLSLLERYRWLAERAMNDPVMADAKVQVQLHCLLWGITTRGV